MAQGIRVEGFSKDELTFIEELPKHVEIECPVCLQVMLDDPHLVTCCGHNYCGSCIQRVIASNRPCPICKETNYQAFVDKKTLRINNGLQVYCINRREGCEWKGELKNLSTHLNKGKREGDCKFQEIKCHYDKCEKKEQRQYLDDHEKNDCPQRPYQCKYCTMEGTYHFITTEHFKKCPLYPLPCPNMCVKDRMFPRSSLSTHLSKGKREGECQYEVVKCRYEECKEKKQRCHLDDHEKIDCLQRPYRCKYCTVKGTYLFIAKEHYNKCKRYPVSCPNKCQKDKIDRFVLNYHLSEKCPLQPVQCMFSWAGCTDRPLRKDSQSHATDLKHMSLLAVACSQLKRENEELAVALKSENKELAVTCSQLKREYEKLQEQMQIVHRALTDSYLVLPVTISNRSPPIHVYTDLFGHYISVMCDGPLGDLTVYLAFHKGMFDTLQPNLSQVSIKINNLLIPLVTDTEAVYDKLPHNILTTSKEAPGVLRVKLTLFLIVAQVEITAS